jgi:hypothetical protein
MMTNASCAPIVIEGGAGGGVAGLRTPVVRAAPKPICKNNSCSVSPDSIVMKGDYQYQWHPAISTGIVFRWARDTSEHAVGYGLGGQLVAAPVGQNVTRLAPAVTLHYGQRRTQVFWGVLLMPSDALDLPGDTVTMARQTDPNLFISPGGRKALNFFVGIVLNGVVSK